MRGFEVAADGPAGRCLRARSGDVATSDAPMSELQCLDERQTPGTAMLSPGSATGLLGRSGPALGSMDSEIFWGGGRHPGRCRSSLWASAAQARAYLPRLKNRSLSSSDAV